MSLLVWVSPRAYGRTRPSTHPCVVELCLQTDMLAFLFVLVAQDAQLFRLERTGCESVSCPRIPAKSRSVPLRICGICSYQLG